MLDIDEELLEYTEKNDTLVADAREYIAYQEKYMPENLEGTLLPVDTRVQHEYFGEGSIIEVDVDKGAYLVQFDDMATPRNISFRARLNRV